MLNNLVVAKAMSVVMVRNFIMFLSSNIVGGCLEILFLWDKLRSKYSTLILDFSNFLTPSFVKWMKKRPRRASKEAKTSKKRRKAQLSWVNLSDVFNFNGLFL